MEIAKVYSIFALIKKINMKKLVNFLEEKPSYLKCGTKQICKMTGVAESTVNNFKKSERCKLMKQNYISNLK